MKEIYTTLDNFITAHLILSVVIAFPILFWAMFIICLIVDRKQIVEDLEWHK